MSQQRKNQFFQSFRRPPVNQSSRSKEIQSRLQHFRSKQKFLTDQTSDYTKSSSEIHPRIEQLEETIHKLQRENSQLKQKIVQLKASQLFQINEDKLRQIIKQSDQLRLQIDTIKEELKQSLVEKDFLQRFNRNLKTQCENLTKEILVLRGSNTTSVTGNIGDSKRQQRNIYTTRDEDSNRSRNSSNQLKTVTKRKEFLQWKKEKEQISNQQNNLKLLKSSMSASQLLQDYYPTRTSRHKAYNNF